MTAVILAAGYGTRLLPHTRTLPKGLLPIGNRPLLEYGVDQLEKIPEVERIVLVTNAKYAEAFREWARRYSGRKAVEVLSDGTDSNETRLGSLGDLALVLRDKRIASDILVLPSDRLFGFPLARFVGYFGEKGATVNACHDLGDPQVLRGKHGCAVIDAASRIVSYEEKPQAPRSSLASIALYAFPRTVLHLLDTYLAEGRNPDSPGYFLEWLHARAPVFAWVFTESCYDIGTVEAYEKLQALSARDPHLFG